MTEPTGGRHSQLNGKLTIITKSDGAPISPRAAAVLLEMLQATRESEAIQRTSLVANMVEP